MTEVKRPTRNSRGKRYRRLLEEEEDADEQFWSQDFFKEDEDDDVYLTESDQESVADSDFSDAESGANEDDPATDEPIEKPTKKRLLPPGAVQKPKKQAKAKLSTLKVIKEEKSEAEETCVTLRQSTLLRRTAAEEERRLQEIRRVKRSVRPSTDRSLMTIELEAFLKEVAETEEMNLASLNELEAVEEESKRRALQTKAKRRGPYITIRSRIVDGSQKTVLELTQLKQPPEWMQPKSRPREVDLTRCVMTGLPAKYRDPLTGLPYATIEAFQAIRKRYARSVKEWTTGISKNRSHDSNNM